VRHRARIELSGRPTAEVIGALKEWLKRLDPADADHEHQVLEGLWVHQQHNVVDVDLLKRVLASQDFRARAAATPSSATGATVSRLPRTPEGARRRPLPASAVGGGPRRELLQRGGGVEVPLISAERPSDYYSTTRGTRP